MKELENIYPEKSNLPEKVTGAVMSVFQPFLTPLKEWLAEVQKLELDDIDDFEQQQLAKMTRAKGKQLRLSIEKSRKELKGPVLEKGRLVDSIAKQLIAFVVPYEEQLKQFEQAPKLVEQEKAEREKAEQVLALAEKRQAILSSYYRPVPLSAEELGTMSEPEFEKHLEGVKELSGKHEKQAVQYFTKVGITKKREAIIDMLNNGTLQDEVIDEYLKQLKKFRNRCNSLQTQLEKANGKAYTSLKQAYSDNPDQAKQFELLLTHIRQLPLPEYKGTKADSIIDLVAGQLLQLVNLLTEAIETNSENTKTKTNEQA